MKTIFKVSEINFVEDGADTLIFLPAAGLEKKFDQIELLQRIFTEEISIEPEPPTYPEIIQQLIDYDPQPQTKSDIAKILSLYNPDDISEIVKKLIAANCQTADHINKIIKSYPYELNSAIFDYKYLNWKKLGNGTVTRDNQSYSFNNSGVQLDNAFPMAGFQLNFTMRIKIRDDTKSGFIIMLFTSINSTSTMTPYFAISYKNQKFIISRLSTNNGTTQTSTEIYSKTYPTGTTAYLRWTIFDDGSSEIRNAYDGNILAQLTSTSTYHPKHIRINANKATTVSYGNFMDIEYFKADYSSIIISQWNNY